MGNEWRKHAISETHHSGRHRRRYRIMSDGSIYRVFPGGILGSFCWPDIDSVLRSTTSHLELEPGYERPSPHAY